MHETVFVVDFGAQYAQLIARRVREAHVERGILRSDAASVASAATGEQGETEAEEGNGGLGGVHGSEG